MEPVETTGICLHLFLHTAPPKAHWGFSRSEGRGEPKRPSLPGGSEDKDWSRSIFEGRPYAHTLIALLLVSFSTAL